MLEELRQKYPELSKEELIVLSVFYTSKLKYLKINYIVKRIESDDKLKSYFPELKYHNIRYLLMRLEKQGFLKKVDWSGSKFYSLNQEKAFK
ncbi:hypothetical protein [Saccharolobus islandicus]|uniref:Plasmid pARN4 n=1 Tax=Saccharolobus islandicus (strain M.16.4 / Kamchatka \|nr:hypothetical protein [Sulfolobus islandicus]ACR41509.1 hypothetical protein M164_0897 [Sulfolobus islandicus M.16.4]